MVKGRVVLTSESEGWQCLVRSWYINLDCERSRKILKRSVIEGLFFIPSKFRLATINGNFFYYHTGAGPVSRGMIKDSPAATTHAEVGPASPCLEIPNARLILEKKVAVAEAAVKMDGANWKLAPISSSLLVD